LSSMGSPSSFYVLSPRFAKWQNPSRHTSRSHQRHLNDTPGRYLTERRAQGDRQANSNQSSRLLTGCERSLVYLVSPVGGLLTALSLNPGCPQGAEAVENY